MEKNRQFDQAHASNASNAVCHGWKCSATARVNANRYDLATEAAKPQWAGTKSGTATEYEEYEEYDFDSIYTLRKVRTIRGCLEGLTLMI
jgi:hypothetical protein